MSEFQKHAAAAFLLNEQEKLSAEQQQLIEKIMSFSKEQLNAGQTAVLVIQGDAGTGKSLILQQAFAKLQQISQQDNESPLYKTQNYLLVNHAEMLKIYRKLAADDPNLKKISFMKPTSFINTMAKKQLTADVVFIDEAHLLLTQADNYNKFHGNDQLQEIMKHSRVVVLVFDPYQVLKYKSHWNTDRLTNLIAAYPHETFQLKQQYRMQAAGDHIAFWINQLTRKRRILPQVTSAAFDFRIFTDAQTMFRQIKNQNRKVGLSRMLATTDFPYTVGKGTWYVQAGDFRLPWDKLDVGNEPWALRDQTIDEVGSIYTIQGFDLNYAAVIIGPSISYDDQAKQITIDTTRYEDHAAFRTPAGQQISIADKQQIMLNALNVLLKRGRRGLYIYACDDKLRRQLQQLVIN